MADLINNLGGPDGFGTQSLAANDDGSTDAIDIAAAFPSGINLFGQTYTSIYVNNNGNVTFTGPLSTYTPAAIGAGYTSPIIAPFWADVDTNYGPVTPTGGNTAGSDLVWYNVDAADHTVTVTWDDVGYYGSSSKVDAFQLQLKQEANGFAQIEFIYQTVEWTTGDASEGEDGLGGTPARVGYSAGNGVNYYEIPSSNDQAALLALPTMPGNTGQAGVYVFQSGLNGIYSFANPQINSSTTLSLGARHVGDLTASEALSVTNAAAAPAEGLDVTASTVSAGLSESGSIVALAAGQTDSSSIHLGIDTTTPGAGSGDVVLGLASDGQGTSGAGITALGSETIAVSGSVYALAVATFGNVSPILHVGDGGSETLIVGNTSGYGAYSEGLIAAIVGEAGDVSSASGATGLIADGTRNTTALTYDVTTSSVGQVIGTVDVALTSDGTGTSGLGVTSLGTQAVAITTTIDNYATAQIVEIGAGATVVRDGVEYTLNLGTVVAGGTIAPIQLGIENAASAFADLLEGSFTATGSGGIQVSGLAPFSGVGAQGTSSGLDVSLNTGTAGIFSEQIVMTPTGYNTSGYEGVLQAETLTVVGTVEPAGAPEITVPTAFTSVRGVPTALSVSVAQPGGVSTDTFVATVSDSNGLLSATGTNVSGSGTTRLSIAGSLSDVNTALATLTDTDPLVQQDQLMLQVADSTETLVGTAFIDVTVAPLAPQLAAPASVSLVAGISTPLGVGLVEPDDFIGNSVTAIASDTYGTLFASGASGASVTTSADGKTLSIVGLSQQVNAVLSTLTDTEATAQADNINISVSDGSGNAAGTSIGVTATVTSAPGGVSNALFYAILSMDAYYRQVTGTLNVNIGDPDGAGKTLGGAIFNFACADASSGFFAASWTNGADTVLAYRGTDELVDDIAWRQFLGSPYTMQGQEALQFYESNNGNSLSNNPKIVLTGHSLGGGLAGWVAGHTGVTSFDNDSIGFSLALVNEYEDNYEAYLANYAAWLITGGTKPVPPTPPIFGTQQGYNLSGEVAILTRAPVDASTSIDPHAGSFQTPVTLHSAALLAIYMYAQNDNAWNPVGSSLFSALTNSNIAGALGVRAVGPHGAADVMDAEIAYSALQSGGTPFGTTGIASLFHDADILGQFYNAALSAALNAADVRTDLGDIDVEYAALLATTGDTSNTSADDVFSYSQQVLQIDLSSDAWAVDDAAAPSIIGSTNLISSVFGNNVAADNVVLATNDTGGDPIDLSADTDTDLVFAGDGSSTFIVGTGTSYVDAGAGTTIVDVDDPGEALYFDGGTGSSTVDASKLTAAETINVIAFSGNISILMGGQEDLALSSAINFHGSIAGFAIGNVIDVRGITADSVTLIEGNVLEVHETDGSGFAIVDLPLVGDYTGDLFDTEPDDNGGTNIRIATLSITPHDPTFKEGDGPEEFTITRYHDLSAAATVYVSTADPSGINTGDFTPLSYQPVTFAAGAATATFTVTIDDGDISGETKMFGLQATDGTIAASNILATDGFTVVSTAPPTASAFGCPYFTSFDGLGFWFQGAGEFVAAKSTVAGNNFQVQMRIEPEGSPDSSVSIITQIAVQVGSDRVTFASASSPNADASRPQIVWVDGAPVSISQANPIVTLAGGVIAEVSDNEYRVILNTGEVVTVTPFGDGMGLSIQLAPTDGAGSVKGFFGANSGQANDFQLADGTVLQQPLTEAQLYQDFANAWRVTDSTSLLDYGQGQNTATFTDTQYPREILTLSDFSPDVVAAAMAAVSAAGITDPSVAAAAAFDYITMGNPSSITEAAAVAGITPTTTTTAQAVITDHTTPAPSVGVLAESASVIEVAGTATAVTFNVNLTSSTTVATVVDYTLTPGAANAGQVFLTSADFGGTGPSGAVTIVAGQTVASFTVDVPDSAIGSATDKLLQVGISAPGGDFIYGTLAQTDIVNNTTVVGTPAEPLVELLPGSSSQNQLVLSRSGNDYTLDLGQVVLDSTMSPLQFAIANMASAPADGLIGTILPGVSTGFDVTGPQSIGTIQPGDAFQGLTIVPLTETLGAQSETLTITPGEINSSGFMASLPDMTLTVEETVIPCFARGTRLATPDGYRCVERLRVGDLVLTHSGRTRPVTWIGERKIDCRRHNRPQAVLPVRIQAGAFADNVPVRDLFLSPDHAVYFGGTLIPVKYLINDTTIAQQSTRRAVHYFHIELDRHDVLMAEGLDAESYLDTGDRNMFANGGGAVVLHPEFSRRRWEAAGYAPLAVTGPAVARLQRHLKSRARRLQGGGKIRLLA